MPRQLQSLKFSVTGTELESGESSANSTFGMRQREPALLQNRHYDCDVERAPAVQLATLGTAAGRPRV